MEVLELELVFSLELDIDSETMEDEGSFTIFRLCFWCFRDRSRRAEKSFSAVGEAATGE